MMDVEALRQMIARGAIDLSDATVIEEGNIISNNGDAIPYRITNGWDLSTALDCDRKWGEYWLQIFDYIDSQDYEAETKAKVLDGLQDQDCQWDWFIKSCHYRGDEYEWFFLLADGAPQGACLIYHPKEAVLGDHNVFYIEFLASAPWNRDNPISERHFRGVGPKLINRAQRYAVDVLGLEYGYSLHALPQACDFYGRIGMIRFDDRAKERMVYFEMPVDLARTFLEEA